VLRLSTTSGLKASLKEATLQTLFPTTAVFGKADIRHDITVGMC